MGCCCSTSSDEWSDSDSDSDSSLPDFPPYIRRSTTTVELKQHTTAGTQHACLDAELKGDSGATCDEETLESHPREALDRLSTGGEENAPDWSNSFYSVCPIDADDLEQEQSQWATDEPGPSTVLLTSLFHTPPPETDPVFFPAPPPETDTVFFPAPPPETDTVFFPAPPPGPDPVFFLAPPPGPDTDLLPPPPPGPDPVFFPAPLPETDTVFFPAPPPGPDPVFFPAPLSGPDTDLLPPPPPGPDPVFFPTPPPGPDPVFFLAPPPGADTDLLPPPPPGPDPVFFPAPLPGPDTDLLPPPPPGPDPVFFPTPPPGPDPVFFPAPPPGADTDLLPPPPPGPDPVFLLTPPPELSLPSEVDVRLTTVSSLDIGQETRRGSTEFEWQDNAELKCPWLPANSRIRKIPSREEGDGPSVPICFYKAPEDLGTLRPERQDVGTQTLPPGACEDASTPSKIHAVCPEQRVMAEGGNSGDKPKGMVWSQNTPQVEFPQTGSSVDIPGPVLELQPSKAQNIQPMLNRNVEQSPKTKTIDQPAHPPGQQVGSKLTYAQVCRMPPRRRAPIPRIS